MMTESKLSLSKFCPELLAVVGAVCLFLALVLCLLLITGCQLGNSKTTSTNSNSSDSSSSVDNSHPDNSMHGDTTCSVHCMIADDGTIDKVTVCDGAEVSVENFATVPNDCVSEAPVETPTVAPTV